jgi:hypothetical protein
MALAGSVLPIVPQEQKVEQGTDLLKLYLISCDEMRCDRGAVDREYTRYFTVAELHLALLCNSIGSEFASTPIRLQYYLLDVRVELPEVERMKIFEPLRQER